MQAKIIASAAIRARDTAAKKFNTFALVMEHLMFATPELRSFEARTSSN